MTMIGNNEEILYKKKSMRIIKIIVVMLVLLFIATIGIAVTIYYEHQKEFKIVINGTETSKLPSDSYIIKDNKAYVSIKDISPYLGEYKYNKGEYKKYSENKTKCYIQSPNEVTNFTLNSNTIYKTITSDSSEIAIDSNNIDYETYTLDDPIIMENDKLYTSAQGIGLACNALSSYNASTNTLSLYTLSYMVSYYQNKYPEAAIGDDSSSFSNKKATLYDLIVVKNENDEYGVISSTGEEIIGKKYRFMQFVENEDEFIVKTDEDKMGIIAKDGTTKIKPEYESIKEIDKKDGLYLVSSKSKYGVINRNGKTLLFMEYDKIGIDSSRFPNDEIRNGYVLYDNCIPVEKNNKFGMFDVNGNMLLDIKYDGFGCSEGKSSDRVANSLLLVPEYEGIVVQLDKQFGLINSSGKELIPALVKDMYSVTSAGVNTYYLTYNNQTMNIIDYLKNTLKIPPVDKTTKTETQDQVENVVKDTNTSITDNKATNAATTGQAQTTTKQQ